MAVVTLLANGTAGELVAAVSTKSVINNTGPGSIVVENAADPAGGIIIKPGETLGLPTGWAAAWTGKSLNGKVATVRVAQE
jgi:hypothetical protein